MDAVLAGWEGAKVEGGKRARGGGGAGAAEAVADARGSRRKGRAHAAAAEEEATEALIRQYKKSLFG
jgi:hypothetical protein